MRQVSAAQSNSMSHHHQHQNSSLLQVDQMRTTPKRTESYASSGHRNLLLATGGPTRDDSQGGRRRARLHNGTQQNCDEGSHGIEPTQNAQLQYQRQQRATQENQDASQHSSLSAERRTTQPNRPSSQLTQLQRGQDMQGYVHDVGSIVTTANNNFDQVPSRTLSRENSNEGRSNEEGGQGYISQVLQTQTFYPNLEPHYPPSSHLDQQHNQRQNNGTSATESTLLNNWARQADQFYSLGSQSPQRLSAERQINLSSNQSQQRQPSEVQQAFELSQTRRMASQTQLNQENESTQPLQPQGLRRIIQVKTLKDRQVQQHILQEYEDEFEQSKDYEQLSETQSRAAFSHQKQPQLQVQLEESKRSYQDYQKGNESTISGGQPAGLEYHTFSLNPEFNYGTNIVAEGHDYLAHGLAINSGSNRFTDAEENQSYQKQVTAAFNNHFSSHDQNNLLLLRGDTIETGGVTSPNDLNNFAGQGGSNQRHKEIDEFLNSGTEQERQVFNHHQHAAQAVGQEATGDGVQEELPINAQMASTSQTVDMRDQYQSLAVNEKQRDQMHQQHFQSLSFDLTKTTPAFKQKLARTVKAQSLSKVQNQNTTKQSSNRSPQSNTYASNVQQSKRSIQERQIVMLKTQLKAYESGSLERKEISRSRANRAPSQIYQFQSLPLPAMQVQSHSIGQLKIPTKEPNSRRDDSSQFTTCPLKPNGPTYPTQFCKRNFSTGGEAYSTVAPVNLKTTHSQRRSSSKKVAAKLQHASAGTKAAADKLAFDQRGSSLPDEAPKFSFARKSHPQFVSASMLPAQQRPGDDDEDTMQSQDLISMTFDEQQRPSQLKDSAVSLAYGAQKSKKMAIHHNPYESIPNTVVINPSKSSTEIHLPAGSYIEHQIENSNQEIDLMTNLQDGSSFAEDRHERSRTQSDQQLIYNGGSSAHIKSGNSAYTDQKISLQFRPFSSVQQYEQQIKRLKKPGQGAHVHLKGAYHQNSKSSAPPSKFSHIKTVSQIGAQIKPNGNLNFANSSSDSFLPSNAHHIAHKTHLSSISGINAALNGSSQTIPSPLLKLTNQKGADVSSASQQNLKQRITDSSDANLVNHTLQLNFQSEATNTNGKQRRSRNHANSSVLQKEENHQYRTLEPTAATGKPPAMRQGSKDLQSKQCGKAARKLKNIQNIFWTSNDIKELPPSAEQTESMSTLHVRPKQTTIAQKNTAQQINLLKLRKLAENQKKQKTATESGNLKHQTQQTSFKITVVDENGVKNGDFSDISHLKFETTKNQGGAQKLPTSKEEPQLLQTEDRAIFMTQDGRQNPQRQQLLNSGAVVKNKQATANSQTYAHRRRNRYLIASTNQETQHLEQQVSNQIRESNSVEAKQSRGSGVIGADFAQSINQGMSTVSMARPPRRLVNIKKDEPKVKIMGFRAGSVVAEDPGSQEEAYPTGQNEASRRGRNFSQLPLNNSRRRGESMGLQRRSITKNSIFQQVDLEQLGIESQSKPGKRANSLVSMLCCYSQKSKQAGSTFVNQRSSIGNQRSSIGGQSVNSQETICAIF